MMHMDCLSCIEMASAMCAYKYEWARGFLSTFTGVGPVGML